MTTPLGQAASAMHEMYLELTRAGFTKSEALTLVSNVLSSVAAQAAQGGADDDADDDDH